MLKGKTLLKRFSGEKNSFFSRGLATVGEKQTRMSVQEAADFLECKKSYIYKLIERGKLERVTSVRVYISTESVRRFTAQRLSKMSNLSNKAN